MALSCIPLNDAPFISSSPTYTAAFSLSRSFPEFPAAMVIDDGYTRFEYHVYLCTTPACRVSLLLVTPELKLADMQSPAPSDSDAETTHWIESPHQAIVETGSSLAPPPDTRSGRTVQLGVQRWLALRGSANAYAVLWTRWQKDRDYCESRTHDACARGSCSFMMPHDVRKESCLALLHIGARDCLAWHGSQVMGRKGLDTNSLKASSLAATGAIFALMGFHRGLLPVPPTTCLGRQLRGWEVSVAVLSTLCRHDLYERSSEGRNGRHLSLSSNRQHDVRIAAMPPPAEAETGRRTPDYAASGRMAGGKPHQRGVILSMDPGCEGQGSWHVYLS